MATSTGIRDLRRWSRRRSSAGRRVEACESFRAQRLEEREPSRRSGACLPEACTPFQAPRAGWQMSAGFRCDRPESGALVVSCSAMYMMMPRQVIAVLAICCCSALPRATAAIEHPAAHASPVRTRALRTASDVYTVGDSRDVLALTIDLQYTNRTSLPRYLPACRGPVPPVLEKLVHGRWIVVYSPVTLTCLEPPVVIAPGDTYRYKFQVNAARRGQWKPELLVDRVAGKYRVRWRMFETWEHLNHPPWFGRLAREDEQISNTFRIAD